MKTIDYGVARVRPATQKDARALAKNMRPEDISEVAAVGKTPLQSTTQSVRSSATCYTVEVDGAVVAIFGVASSNEPLFGNVWMLGSPNLYKIKHTFLRHSASWVRELFGEYRLLGNIADARNELHIRWLKWLGFRFVRSLPGLGVNGEDFIEFIKIKEEAP